MGVVIQEAFDVQGGPIDNRFVVNDQSARYNLGSTVIYEGLVVYQKDTDSLFVLVDTSNKDNTNGWTEITNQTTNLSLGGTGTGFPFTGSAHISGNLEITSNLPGTSTAFTFTPDSTGTFGSTANLKINHYNGTPFSNNAGNPNNTGFSNNSNNPNNIFETNLTVTNLYKDALILLDLEENKILDNINFTLDGKRIFNEVTIFGSNTSLITSTTLLESALLSNSASLLVEGAVPISNASEFNPSSNPIDLSNGISSGNTQLVSQIPLVKKRPFRYYVIKIKDSIYTTAGSQNVVSLTSNNFVSFKQISLKTQNIGTTTSDIILNNGIISSSKVVAGGGHFDTIQVTNLQKPDGTNFSLSGGTTVAANPEIGGQELTTIQIGEENFTIPTNPLGILGSIDAHLVPEADVTYTLGNKDNKWQQIFARDTFFGGIHEINLETEGLDKMQEGTVLSLQNGTMCPCEKEGDPLVMGVVSKGENYPIVLGAEPVLVTGKIEEGDYIITSKIKGHGKGINPKHIYDQQLFGKIIAQAIERGNDKSYTIKAMIRKM